MQLFDISVPIRPGMIVYDGDPDVHLERVKTIAAGASANVSRIDFGVHTGTHVDAPGHFIDGAPGVETLPLDALVGPAYVIDATGISGILMPQCSLGLRFRQTQHGSSSRHRTRRSGISIASQRTSSRSRATRRRRSSRAARGSSASTTYQSGRKATVWRHTSRCSKQA